VEPGSSTGNKLESPANISPRTSGLHTGHQLRCLGVAGRVDGKTIDPTQRHRKHAFLDECPFSGGERYLHGAYDFVSSLLGLRGSANPTPVLFRAKRSRNEQSLYGLRCFCPFLRVLRLVRKPVPSCHMPPHGEGQEKLQVANVDRSSRRRLQYPSTICAAHERYPPRLRRHNFSDREGKSRSLRHCMGFSEDRGRGCNLWPALIVIFSIYRPSRQF
jgi:hypothetical protein